MGGLRIPDRHILALQGCYELVSQEEANIHGNGRDKRIAIQDTEVKEGFQINARQIALISQSDSRSRLRDDQPIRARENQSKCVPTEKLNAIKPDQNEFHPKMLETKKGKTIRQFLEESSERSSLEQRGVFDATVARIEVAFDWLMKILDESNGPKGLTTTEIVEHYEGMGKRYI